MKSYITIIFLAIAYLAPSQTIAALIGLEGDEIDAAIIRTIDDPFFGSGRIFGAGLDAPFTVENGTSDQQQFSSAFLLDVESFSFSIDYIGLGTWQDNIIFRLSDLDFRGGSNLLSGLEIDTNVLGLTWSVGSDYIDLIIGNTPIDEGLYINGNFLVVGVPEPSSIFLLLAALVALIFTKQRSTPTVLHTA